MVFTLLVLSLLQLGKNTSEENKARPGNPAGYSMATLQQTNLYFRVSCAVGLLLSLYALYVEVKKEGDDKYKAYCDINEHISCTKAFSSGYGKGFGVIGRLFGEESPLNQPNSVAGIAFYCLITLTSFSNERNIVKLQTVFCILSNFMSIYLACILYFVLQDFCVVCVGTYIINAINLALSILKLNLIKRPITGQTKSKHKTK